MSQDGSESQNGRRASVLVTSTYGKRCMWLSQEEPVTYLLKASIVEAEKRPLIIARTYSRGMRHVRCDITQQ
jgi:hypothetical protein